MADKKVTKKSSVKSDKNKSHYIPNLRKIYNETNHSRPKENI